MLYPKWAGAGHDSGEGDQNCCKVGESDPVEKVERQVADQFDTQVTPVHRGRLKNPMRLEVVLRPIGRGLQGSLNDSINPKTLSYRWCSPPSGMAVSAAQLLQHDSLNQN